MIRLTGSLCRCFTRATASWEQRERARKRKGGRDFTIDVIFEQMHVLQSSIPITCKNLGGKLSPQGADVELGVARLRKGSEKRVLRANIQRMRNQE